MIGTANSLAATSCWIANAAVSEAFGVITKINLAAEVTVYMVLGLFAVAAWFFTYFLIPETAGKTIEQILEEILGHP